MESKTGKQVQGDVYHLLKESRLARELSGKVYRNGYRPRDSRMEDAVVIFTAGIPGDIQSGIVTINIYVPDIDPYKNGVWVENGKRTEQIEALAQEWVDSIKAGTLDGYLIRLGQTICTDHEPQTQQHFVVIKLKYKYINEK